MNTSVASNSGTFGPRGPRELTPTCTEGGRRKGKLGSGIGRVGRWKYVPGGPTEQIFIPTGGRRAEGWCGGYSGGREKPGGGRGIELGSPVATPIGSTSWAWSVLPRRGLTPLWYTWPGGGGEIIFSGGRKFVGGPNGGRGP